MKLTRNLACASLGMTLGLGIAPSSSFGQQQVIEDVLLGLEALQFDFVGGHNPLSLGFNGTAVRNFQGETLDFGSTELTLNGPFQTSVEYGTRGFKTLDISFNTAGQPLQYLFSSDTGGQASFVSGNFLLDGRLSINQFGFYDMHLEYSSRQDIVNDGRFSDLETEQDFDLGPVDVSGNIFADILAAVFDPIFDATNTNNIFASFSGQYQLQEQLEQAARLIKNDEATGSAMSTSRLADLLINSGKSGAIPVIAVAPQPDFSGGPVAIPEPVLVGPLALLATVIVGRRTRRC